MKENNKNEESGDSGTLRMLAQPPDIPTLNSNPTKLSAKLTCPSPQILQCILAGCARPRPSAYLQWKRALIRKRQGPWSIHLPSIALLMHETLHNS